MLARVLGVFALLGSLVAAGFAYLEAGGGQGWQSFRVDALLDRNDAPFASAMAIGLFVIAVLLFVAGRSKKS
jgi:hypothetical protein